MSLFIRISYVFLLGAVCAALCFSTFSLLALAQTNPQINYQGKLTDASGLAVPDGTYNMRFWLIDSAVTATTTADWTESRTGGNQVQVTNGLFSVMLGSVSSLTAVDFNQTLYLGVEVGGIGSPAWDGEMSPRKILGTVPAAFEARQLGGVASTSFLRSDQADTASGLLTFTGGLLSNSSSTINNLTTLTATTTNLVINSERFTDLTGTGLTNTGGVLSVATSTLGLSSAFTTSAQLASLLSDETGTGNAVFSASPTFTGTTNFAAADFTGNVALGGTSYISSTGAARFINGTAGAPSIGFENDVNTGFYAGIAAEVIGVATNGTLMAVFNNGKFGVGTSTPASTVDVWGSFRVGTTTIPTLFANSANSFVGIGTTTQVGTERLNVAGNINIGTSNRITASPASATQGLSFTDSARLRFAGTSGADVAFGVNNTGITAGSSASYTFQTNGVNSGAITSYLVSGGNSSLQFQTRGSNTFSEKMIITPDGNVGIATSSPSSKLTVAGDLRVTGAFKDTSGDAGTSGQVLASTLTGTNWVSTSTLGFSSSFSTSAGLAALLSDETGTGNAVFSASPTFTGTLNAAASTFSSTLTLSGSAANIALGSNFLSGDGGDEGIGLDSSGRTTIYTTTGAVSSALNLENASAATGAGSQIVFANNTLTHAQISQQISSGGGNTDLYFTTRGSNVLTEHLRITAAGNIGIGTSSPSSKLTVAGDLRVTGAFKDTSGDAGTSGQVLASTLTGTNWVSTSTLGFSSSFSTSAGLAALLSDETGTGALVFSTSPTFTTSANFGAAGVRLSDDGDGAITFLGLGNGSDEALTLNLDDTANTGTVTSSTGLDTLTFTDIGINVSSSTQGYQIGGQTMFTANPSNQIVVAGGGIQTTATSTVRVGYSAGAGDFNSSYSNYIGTYAGLFSGGVGSNYMGYYAGANSQGYRFSNVIGYQAGQQGTGDFNNFIGANTGRRNEGDYNDFIGYQTGRYLNSTSTVALGSEALFGSHATTYIGLNNTAIGYRAGYAADDGADNNILLGYQAADNLTTGNNNIIIGYDIDNVTATADNRLNIGNLIFGTGLDGTGTTLASGNVGIGTSSPSSKLTVAGDLRVTGAFKDTSGDAGTSGQVLLSTGTGTNWVATSSLGISVGSSFSDSAGLAALLSDETGTGAAVFGTNPTFTGNQVTFASLTTARGLFLDASSRATTTATSAYLTNSITDETGSGILVFGTSPALTTPTIAGATVSGTLAYNPLNSSAFTITSNLTGGARSAYPVVVTQANDATFNNTVGLMQLTNADTGSAAALLQLTQVTTGAGISITGVTTGTSISVSNTTGGTGYAANSVTSGTGFSATALNTGTGFSAGTALTTGTVISAASTALTSGAVVAGSLPNTVTTGSVVRVTSAAAGITADYTGALIDLSPTRTMTAATTRTESGNYLRINRSNTTNGASSIYAITGALAALSSNCTQTLGTCTDTSNILSLTQSYAAASGAVLTITGAGTGNLATLDTTNASANGLSIDLQSNSSSQFAFRVTGNNAANNILYARADGNVGIGTTTPSAKLTVAGDVRVSGALYDNANSAGTNGMLLQTTGSGFAWVATSSLGFSSSFSTSAGLAALLSNETGTGFAVFSDTPTFTGTLNAAAATLSSTLTLSGSAANIALGSNYLSGDGGDEGISVDSSGRAYVESLSGGINPVFTLLNTGVSTNSGNQLAFKNGSVTQFTLSQQIMSSGNSDVFFSVQGSSVLTERMRITAAGNVGIGTSTPWSRLSVVGGISAPGRENAIANEAFGRGSAMLAGSGIANTLLGAYTNVSGATNEYNTIVGAYSSSSNSYNAILGSRSFASGYGNILIGDNIRSTSNNAIVIGQDGGRATNNALMAFGYQPIADYADSMVFGWGQASTKADEIVFGSRRTSNITPSLRLSGSTNAFTERNLFEVDTSWIVGTEGSQQGRVIFNAYDTVAREFMRADTTGSAVTTLFNGGNVGIGTSTPNALFGVQKTSYATNNGVALMDQWIQTTGNTSAGTQYGTRQFLQNSNTATTTLVANLFRVQDSTTYGNTVRGLEVQTNRGTNTLGENTAISGTGRTFGVRGITEGDAGGTFEPAGGFFQTRGTTQGNAIRGYSASITSATLLSLFQDTSAFTGTGLEMNFGNTTGSFSNATSKYLDFQNAGTSVFTVTAYGTTTIGDGTNMAGLQIGNGGLCVDNDGSCAATVKGRIASVSSFTGNSDLAEMYFSSMNLETGDIVTLDGGLSVTRAEQENNLPILGVVSTKPGLLLGSDDTSLRSGEQGYPVALKGRVPVKLSTENGPIRKGDELMLSSLPGVAMKATSTGAIVGIALEDFDEDRMYSETYVNQFSDDIANDSFVPIEVNTDPRINDGCYFGGGAEAGEEPCVPLVATSSNGQITEANGIARNENKERVVRELRARGSQTRRLTDGRNVTVGQVVMFVDLRERWLAIDQQDSLKTLFDLGAITNVGENQSETLFDRIKNLANNFVDGVLSVFEIKANRVEVSEELCVDGVCLDAEDLRRLLEGNGIDPGTPNEPSGYDPQSQPPAEEIPLPDVIEEAPIEPVVEVTPIAEDVPADPQPQPPAEEVPPPDVIEEAPVEPVVEESPAPEPESNPNPE